MVEERARAPRTWVEQCVAWWSATHPPAPRAAAPAAGTAPALASRIVVRNRRGSEVEEEWVRFGPDGVLVGILTRPLAAAEGPAVVLVNGGTNHRPGINRNYAEWAREWAEDGSVVLRMDIRGLGDSAPVRRADEAVLYRDETRDDVRAAVGLLAQRFPAMPILCGGLCAGGYQAFHTALEDPRIDGVFLLNPLRFEPRQEGGAAKPAGDATLAHYARSLRSPRRWLRALRGEVDLLGVGRSVATRLARQGRARALGWAATVRGAPPPPATWLAGAFLSLAERGCRVLVLFNAEEAIRARFDEDLSADRGRLIETDRFRVEVVEHTDHILLPLWSQSHVGRLLESHLLAWGRRTGGGAPGRPRG
jgi:dienelactone hydrolase